MNKLYSPHRGTSQRCSREPHNALSGMAGISLPGSLSPWGHVSVSALHFLEAFTQLLSGPSISAGLGDGCSILRGPLGGLPREFHIFYTVCIWSETIPKLISSYLENLSCLCVMVIDKNLVFQKKETYFNIPSIILCYIIFYKGNGITYFELLHFLAFIYPADFRGLSWG